MKKTKTEKIGKEKKLMPIKADNLEKFKPIRAVPVMIKSPPRQTVDVTKLFQEPRMGKIEEFA